jgi:hypothetical protein
MEEKRRQVHLGPPDSWTEREPMLQDVDRSETVSWRSLFSPSWRRMEIVVPDIPIVRLPPPLMCGQFSWR